MTNNIVTRLITLGFTEYKSNDKDRFKGFGKAKKSFILKGNNVVGINVSGSGLRQIPKYISESRFLKKLYLNDNKIKDINFLNELPNLIYVDLKNNGLTDDCGIDNIKLPKLRCLLLNDNKFTKISEEMIDGNKLRYLNYSNNDIKTIPKNLRNSSVKYFLINNNRIESLEHIPFLVYSISARGNGLTNESMDVNFRKDCPNIKQVCLSENNLTHEFDVPKNLSKLSIRKNDIEDCKRQLEVVDKFKAIKSTFGDLVEVDDIVYNSIFHNNAVSNMFAQLDDCKIVV